MKNIKLLALLSFLMLASSVGIYAQYDDMYYNPDKDKGFFEDYNSNKSYASNDRDYAYNNNDDSYYDDDQYDYYNDYDYYYTSRIRRFNRPYYGFNFYDPVYVDLAYYDPHFSPGVTVLIYDDVFAFNDWYRWNRWNRWNTFGFNVGLGFGSPFYYNSFSPWGGGYGYGFNSWDPFYRYNSWYGPNYSYNYYNFGGGYYCPPTWGNNYVYNTINDIRDNTYYGPRMNGTTKTPQLNARDIRRENVGDATNTFPRNTTAGTVMPKDGRIQPNGVNAPEKMVTEREKAHSERISIFNDNERNDYNRTIGNVRNGSTLNSTFNRRDGNTSNGMNPRINRNDNINRSTNQRNYSIFPRSRTNDTNVPRTQPRRNNSSNGNNNMIRRENNTRSSTPTWNRPSTTRSSSPDWSRSSSPSRSETGSTRSSGSNTRSSGSNSSSNGPSRRGHN